MSKHLPYHKISTRHSALLALTRLGYTCLQPAQILEYQRNNNFANIILEGTLRSQLQKINRIRYGDQQYLFSEANIQEAIHRITTHIQYGELVSTNHKAYDLLVYGTALQQHIDAAKKSFTLNYIDWGDYSNNVFHAIPEFPVKCQSSNEIVRSDIVLFVNGIPFCVIECAQSDGCIDQAISQNICHQSDRYIPQLFSCTQLVVAIDKENVKYSTVGVSKEFWGQWKELEDTDEELASSMNRPLSEQEIDVIFLGTADASNHNIQNTQEYRATYLDQALHSLCRPERLLDLTRCYMIFDGNIKKVARYQQFFVVRSALKRIKQRDAKGRREGGIVWHTQGSGKSLTMVMLANALMLDPEIKNARIILVTDRKDLDRQLGKTFSSCGLDKKRATSGRNLIEHLKNKVDIITTLVHKFNAALKVREYQDDSDNIFVLLDESHRSQYGEIASKMRMMMPNACYIGFTGTPLLKKEKSSFQKFGQLIEPHYSIQQAIADRVVVPLLYEGRRVDVGQDSGAMDLWFEKLTEGLGAGEKEDLLQKFNRSDILKSSDPLINAQAFDISEHYSRYWKGTGAKAQIVVARKSTAIKYHKVLQAIGDVSSAVVISGPDTREGSAGIDEEHDADVNQFWKQMMDRYGSEDAYVSGITRGFIDDTEPEIIIVVDKLLTGFDAPPNTVLYLCRELRGHTLLQAIARVNRIYDVGEQSKEHGYIIDYVGSLGALDNALTMYEEFKGYDIEDVEEALTSIRNVTKNLPRLYRELLIMFEGVAGTIGSEEHQVFLADNKLRQQFYEQFSKYGRALHGALSTWQFIADTDEATRSTYKQHLRDFATLRNKVKLRYGEVVNHRDYESKIENIINLHVTADNVIRLHEPIDILDTAMVRKIADGYEEYSSSSKRARADTITYATKRTITEKYDENPAFYQKLSAIVSRFVKDFEDHRVGESEYLNRALEARGKAVVGQDNDMPDAIKGDNEACAYYATIMPLIERHQLPQEQVEAIACAVALSFKTSLEKQWKVNFWNSRESWNTIVDDIDDLLFDDIQSQYGLDLSGEEIDALVDKIRNVAKARRGDK